MSFGLELLSPDLLAQLRRGFGGRGQEVPVVWPFLSPVAVLGPQARPPLNTFRQLVVQAAVSGIAAQGSFVGVFNNSANVMLVRSAKMFFLTTAALVADFVVGVDTQNINGGAAGQMQDVTDTSAIFGSDSARWVTGTNVANVGSGIVGFVQRVPGVVSVVQEIAPGLEIVLQPGAVAGWWVVGANQVAGSNMQASFELEQYQVSK